MTAAMASELVETVCGVQAKGSSYLSTVENLQTKLKEVKLNLTLKNATLK